MKLFIANDHAGLEMKISIIENFKKNIEFIDLGTDSLESVHYPEFAKKLCHSVLKSDERGILICGTGIGVSITANRFKGIRASLCHSEFDAQMTREHNDSNVLCLGARTTDKDLILKIVDRWVETSFLGGRHLKRIEMIDC